MAFNKDLARQIANPEKILLKNVPHLDQDVWLQPLSGSKRLEYLTDPSREPDKSAILEMFESFRELCCIGVNINYDATDCGHALVFP